MKSHFKLIILFLILANVGEAENLSIVIGQGEAYAPCQYDGSPALENMQTAIERAIENAKLKCGSAVQLVSEFETKTVIDGSRMWTCGVGHRYYAQAEFRCLYANNADAY